MTGLDEAELEALRLDRLAKRSRRRRRPDRDLNVDDRLCGMPRY